jgi:hypothetical protein
VWEVADQFGFLILGRIADRKQLFSANDFQENISCLGWLLAPELFQDEVAGIVLPGFLDPQRHLVGIEVTEKFDPSMATGLSFLAGKEAALSSVANINLPKLVLGKDPADIPSEWIDEKVLGWICTGAD